MKKRGIKKLTLISGLIFVISFFAIGLRVDVFNTKAQEADLSIDELNRQIDEQKAKIDKLNDQIAEYNKNVKSARNEAANLQGQIKFLDNQIAKTNIDISAKEEQLQVTELEIKKIQLEIARNEAMIKRDREQLGGLIRLLARYDNKNYIEILLSNETFSDFFDQVKYSEDIQRDVQKTLNQVQELVVNLSNEQKDLDAKRTQLMDLTNKLEQTKSVLGDKKDDKTYLITETKQSEKKYQALIASLKKEQAAANGLVGALERKIRAKLVSDKDARFNALGTAALSWPLRGPITATFHDPTYPYRSVIGEHSGLDLGVGMGTPVAAAEGGYVAKVALGTKWYGNYIMIIHSNNLSTLYAHLSSVGVSADQYVSKGQIIGYSGSTGFSSGPHLHFEVRSNGVPVDPLGYLP